MAGSPHTLDQDGPLGPGRPPAVAAKLVVVEGPDEGTEAPLEGSVLVGTDDSCDLVLHDGSVSRRHAAFERAGAGVVVRDLGSKNGPEVVHDGCQCVARPGRGTLPGA